MEGKLVNACSREKIESRFSEQQRKQLQHEIKIYMQQYFKQKLGKGVDYTKITIFEDMLIIRGEGFLTEPEKFIAQTSSGRKTIRAARTHVVLQHWHDNKKYIEEKLNAKVIHHIYDIEPENDFWMHAVVFDRNFFDR
ncbi:hypothetical protein SPSYN_00613 [Sporotomaculum syntrophicum]|uniref:Na+-translocating membrane potential-generating system MpsC domain-containing protein n=1 Tax=Sporotomaculum syntrophicum TaxID=182264 RepID=A0A9D2WR79_9FIRM|nr:DUF2294 domain-containing protein [Sporotomaculum syntrophicum]KAF1085883.1 hypothetical protein SPSYN_00613 [Sporotomaculum syntrophicum]